MRRAWVALCALLVLGGCGIYGPPERPNAAPPGAQAAPAGTGAQDAEREDGEKPK
jgi:hypothetical protein